MFKKVSEGCYLNFDNILEFGVVPWYDSDNKCQYLIMYWDILGEEHQIPGTFETEEEANEALNKLMDNYI